MEYVWIKVELPADLGEGFEHCYEFRPPNQDEWFLSVLRYGQGGMVEYRVVQADKDMKLAFFIVKRTKPCLSLV